MGKIAFVFPGQGAQTSGMGFSFYEGSKAAREVFELADKIRPGTSSLCFEGSDEDLQITENTQPCLYTVEMAALCALTEAGISADVAAGFSLGELSALTYSGVLSLEDGLSVVKLRSELMQAEALKHDTKMAAVMKLSNEEIEDICSRFSNIYPVNYNCPGQMSVSGDAAEMEAFQEAVKAAGGRARILKVNGAFHSPYMDGAYEGFIKGIENIAFNEPRIPVYSNYTGTFYTGDLKDTLSRQINNPVKWETIIRDMISKGVDTFIELGAGKTLLGLIKRIDPDVKLIGISNMEELESFKNDTK